MSSDEHNSAGPNPGGASSGPAVLQSELDALIAAFEAKETRAQAGEFPSNSAATPDPLAGGAEVPVPVVVFSPTAADASDINTLIQRVTALQVPDPKPIPAQPEIDRVFAELSSVAETEDFAAKLPDRLPPLEPEIFDSDDTLTADIPGADATLVADVLSGETQHHSAKSSDALLDFEDDGPVPALGPDPMDELLAPITESSEVSAEMDAETRAEDEAAGLAAAAPIIDSVTQTTVIEDIGSENVAAVAAAVAAGPAVAGSEPVEAKTPAPKPAASAATPAKAAAASDGAAPPEAAGADAAKPSWLPPSPLAIMLEQPIRSAVALGVGVFAGVFTFAFLWSNPLRRHEVLAGEAAKELGLDRAVRTAESMMEQHDYIGALALITPALEGADPSEEHYADALFLRAQAMVRSAPEQLSESGANALHVAIDDAVEAGHEHPMTGEALMWKAQVYEREGNIPAARAELRGILENYGNVPGRDTALLAMAELELRTKRYEESLDAAERLVDEHPGSPLTARARIVQGDAYVARGNPKAARAVYMLATAEHPDSAMAMAAGERLGRLAVESGQPQAAIEELERRLDTATTVEGNDAVYLVLARAYRATGQLEKSRNILNEILQFFPESEITQAALVELSEVLDELGLHAEAGRMADHAAQRYPSDPDVLARVGRMLADRGQPLGAAEKLAAAYDAGARGPDVLLSAADYFFKGGALKEAQAAYARVVEEHGGSAEAMDAQIGWARAARGLGDLQGAFTRLEDLSAANQGRPSLLPVLQELASLYRELGLTGEMIETYGKVAGITDEPTPLAEAAQALIEAGAADEGLEVAKRVDVARLDPAQAYALLQAWGRTLLRGNADDAMALLMRAHEQYPDQRTAGGVDGTLRAALTLGRSAQARALVADLQQRVAAPERAADRPTFERAAIHYADFLFERGDYAAADEAYAMVTQPSAATDEAAAPSGDAAAVEVKAEESDAQQWSAYQRANAAYALGQLTGSLPMYDAVAASSSPYAADAKARAEVVRFELRRRGEPDPTAPAEATS